jgi:hypothetical protein
MANNILDRMFIKLSEMLDNSIKLAEVQLENGSFLTQESEEFIIGELAYIQDVEGNVVPADPNTYVAMDGTQYVVDENGALASISAPEATETPEVVEVVEEPAAEPMVETIEAAEVEVTIETPSEEGEYQPMEDESEIHRAQMESLIAAVGELMNRVESLEAQVAQLSNTTTELSKQPAALSLSAIPQTYEKPLSREELRIARLRAMAEQEKNK